eukprot:gene7628-11688_t
MVLPTAANPYGTAAFDHCSPPAREFGAADCFVFRDRASPLQFRASPPGGGGGSRVVVTRGAGCRADRIYRDPTPPGFGRIRNVSPPRRHGADDCGQARETQQPQQPPCDCANLRQRLHDVERAVLAWKAQQAAAAGERDEMRREIAALAASGGSNRAAPLRGGGRRRLLVADTLRAKHEAAHLRRRWGAWGCWLAAKRTARLRARRAAALLAANRRKALAGAWRRWRLHCRGAKARRRALARLVERGWKWHVGLRWAALRRFVDGRRKGRDWSSALEGAHGAWMSERLTPRLTTLEARIASVSQQYPAIGTRISVIEDRLNAIPSADGTNSLETHVATLHTRCTKLATGLADTAGRIDTLAVKQQDQHQHVSADIARVAATQLEHSGALADVSGEVRGNRLKIEALETRCGAAALLEQERAAAALRERCDGLAAGAADAQRAQQQQRRQLEALEARCGGLAADAAAAAAAAEAAARDQQLGIASLGTRVDALAAGLTVGGSGSKLEAIEVRCEGLAADAAVAAPAGPKEGRGWTVK